MLIRAALCEDNEQDQKEVARHLVNWSSLRSHQVELRVFPYTDRLIGEIDEDYDSYDLFLLDIEMRNPQEGLDFARRIRLRSTSAPIIFITSHTELTYDSYDVYALNFVAKPIREVRFFAALDSLVNLLKQKKIYNLTCVIDGSGRHIPFADIFFIDTDNHYLRVNSDAELRFRGKLNDLCQQYPADLILCHQSYAVNIAKVHSILFRDSMVQLTNGLRLPVSRSHIKTLWKALEGFYASQKAARDE
ncbi:MAG: LytTR family DNA-binding domain-containing protein [Symbiobacteriaceae bacterium]|nr:LytTR family DNA-binding domain-containing protein [Symbiobacteriaceae bacterium]